MIGRLLEDLRFVVGLLFAIFGVILLGVHTFAPQPNDELQLNLLAGAAMLVFGVVMVMLAVQGDKRDAAQAER